MKKYLHLSLLVFTVFVFFCFSKVYADELDDINKQLSELNTAYNQSKAVTAPLESQLNDIKKRVAFVEADIAKKKKEINNGYKNLEQKKTIFDITVTKNYIESYNNNWLSYLIGSEASEIIQNLAYQKAKADQDKVIITNIALSITDLEEKKSNLENEEVKLADTKTKLDKVITEAKAYQETLSNKIAELSARQQEILAAKTGTFQTSVGDVPLADDPNASPNYNPGFSPAFAAFSFGAPHFKGMSQYGAFGRAKQGQNVEQILKAYYGEGIEIKRDYDSSRQIGVAGYGRMDIETYVKRIYEVPNSWGDEGGMEALKAQAVAARSYALAWTREGTGGDICTNENCQVYKNADKGGNWEKAVNDTRGWVLIKDGKIISSWYASTSGGYQESYNALGYLQNGSNYSTPGFWDTSNGKDGWTSQAYEKIAGSPWFYKGWYKTRSGTSCGRSHPWLTNEEFADIVNAAIVYQAGGDMSGIFPEDVQNCFGGSDSPWSKSRLKEEANKHGGGLSSVSNISVVYSTSGVTIRVIIDGKEIDGQKFYKAFNLRAPGAIHLKSGLFNIEKR